MSEPSDGRLGRRLRRILLLLPYAIQHPGVSIDELSRKFGVKKQDLLDDLNLVFLCGLPGYGPGDLIDVTLDEDKVFVRMADYFAAPLRLTPAEALELYAGASALAELPEMEEADALRRALGKLGRALGLAGDDGSAGIEVRFEAGTTHLGEVQHALTANRRIAIEYLAASSGELSSRTVDPWGLVAALGRWYLVGLDDRSGEERMFRIDRIKSVRMLEEEAQVPEDFDPERYKGGFGGGSGGTDLVLEISPDAARWFADYYPVSETENLTDGWQRVHLVASGERWAATLLLQLGSHVRAVQPQGPVDAARRLAASIGSRYS